jgi:hypothetical protein
MAIAQIAAPATSVDIPVPTVPNGYAAGDIMIAFVYCAWEDNYDTSSNITGADPSWVQLDQATFQTDAGPPVQGDRLAVFYRVSTGVEPATYTFNWAQTALVVARISSYRNVQVPTTPGIVSQADVAGTITLALTGGPTAQGALISAAYAARSDGTLNWALDANLIPRTDANQIFFNPNFGSFSDTGLGAGTTSVMSIGDIRNSTVGVYTITSSIGSDPAAVVKQGLGLLVIMPIA